ncbi:hypothetical protein PHLGIDRAFT_266925 [Phlebiopsis gigantea 11061_1 CR5-6]|uniref:Secreted protein n=1 Tax=Phlebiopsis gigantea (strain 11061_1 CR5-6) TaxID=745531 RepID=A0A0C3S3S6_PHLG1|nr:hypothetical protein PHLGIDRAFT_266925 [Phlebiopsis gigantea 11061_1 CR5-6]
MRLSVVLYCVTLVTFCMLTDGVFGVPARAPHRHKVVAEPICGGGGRIVGRRTSSFRTVPQRSYPHISYPNSQDRAQSHCQILVMHFIVVICDRHGRFIFISNHTMIFNACAIIRWKGL